MAYIETLDAPLQPRCVLRPWVAKGLRMAKWAVLLLGVACAASAVGMRGYLRPSLVQQEQVAMLVLGADASRHRADLISLLVVSPRTGRVAMIQIPRDTRVESAGRVRRLNSLLGLKDGRNGVATEVAELSGLRVDRTVCLTFDSAIHLLKALAPKGVQVDLPAAVDIVFSRSEGAYHLELPKGPQRVTPTQFFYLCRLRQNAADTSKKGGDVQCRLPRQRQMLVYLAREIAAQRDPRIVGRVRKALRALDTDLSERELVALMWTLKSCGSKGQLRIAAAPGSPSRGGMWRLDEKALADQVDVLRAWTAGRTVVPVSLLARERDEAVEAAIDAIRAASPAAHVHIRRCPARMPQTWVAYAEGMTAEESKAAKQAARDIAVRIGAPPPHRSNGSCGVTVALAEDSSFSKEGHQ